jgi:hypothetical protein
MFTVFFLQFSTLHVFLDKLRFPFVFMAHFFATISINDSPFQVVLMFLLTAIEDLNIDIVNM